MRTWGYGLAAATALVAYRLSFALYPLYWARPAFVIEPASLLAPPGLVPLVVSTAGLFGIAVVIESALRRRLGNVSVAEAFEISVRSYAPTFVLLPGLLLLIPGAPGVSPLVAFVLLDGRPWLASLAFIGSLALKLGRADLPRFRTVAIPLALLFVALVLLTPGHRFRQPYDERFGTGDEPRYVRIAASLLHDGDADVSNAADNVGRRFDPGRTARGLASIPGAVLRASTEAVGALFGVTPPGEASSLGGQVVAGRRGGEYYVYLPGFPLLLLPAMAFDSLVSPSHLGAVMLFCIALAVVNAFALFRLVGVVYPEEKKSIWLSISLALTPPLFAYSFQIYPEVAASICLSVCLIPILRDAAFPSRRELVSFAMGASLLPWLHTKYYSILGILVLAFLVRHRRLAPSRLALALGLPVLAVSLQGLYLFEITGSVLPDALWVLNGYPRGGHLLNAHTPRGLDYLFLGVSEGLLVYAPHYLFALLGLFALRRQSPRAFWLALLLLVPYVLIAASHDEGGAGGWSPPSRYFVAVIPVFALGFAAWHRESRGVGILLLFAASFWIGLGMLVERNFLYDRMAFLGSGAVDPSPFLRAGGAYPALLACAALALLLVERNRVRRWVGAGSFALVVVVAGQAARLWSEPTEWVKPRNAEGARTLRPGRTEPVLFRDCKEPVLRFEGGETPVAIVVRAPGFHRAVVVPPSSRTELPVAGEVFFEWAGGSRVLWRILSLRSAPEGDQVRVEPFCREGVERAHRAD